MGSTLETERVAQQFRLSDGRRLGYAEYGDLQGKPVLYFHGWVSSRLEPRTGQKIYADLNLRLIAPDRPGYGLSDFRSRLAILDWVSDVKELAQHLELRRFAVLGISGGGPYAAACAARLAAQTSIALLVCSMAPTDAPGAIKGMVALNRCLLSFARTAPWLAQCVAGFCLKFFWHKGNQVIPERIEAQLPPADRRTLASAELRDALTASSMEALRNGVDGAVADGLLYARPWGFRLEEICIPVSLWHGEADVVVPPSMGRYLAKAIPNCRATFYPDDGHFSLASGRIGEILRSIPV